MTAMKILGMVLTTLPAVLCVIALAGWALSSAFRAVRDRRRRAKRLDWANDNPGGDDVVGNIMERL